MHEDENAGAGVDRRYRRAPAEGFGPETAVAHFAGHSNDTL